MLRFFISVAASLASTSASGTCRRSSSRYSACVMWNRVSLCHNVSSPSNPTTRTAIVHDYPVSSRLVCFTSLPQESKLARSGLGDLFLGVEILTEKNAESYGRVFQRRGIMAREFVMVGNSLRSDVVPVVELGGRAVHIPYQVTWQHEHVPDDELPEQGWRRISAIGELPALLEELEAA